MNEVIRTISVSFRNRKINNFLPLRRISAQKIVTSVVFCSRVFVLLAGFGLIYTFVCSKFYCQKKKQTRSCPDDLIHYTTIKRLGGWFNDKTVCVSPKISLIDSFGLSFSFWLIVLTMFRISKF